MPRGVALLFGLDLAFVAAYVLNFLLGAPSEAWTRVVDVNAEWNPPTLYSAAQLLLLAAGLRTFARGAAERGRADRLALRLLPVLAFLLAVDELAQAHEGLGMLSDRLLPHGTRVGTAFGRTGIWMLLLAPPLIAAASWIGWRARAHLRYAPRARHLMGAGLAVFLLSAVGLELASNLQRSWPAKMAQHAVEELGEMLGVTIMVWGAHELLAARGLRWPRPWQLWRGSAR